MLALMTSTTFRVLLVLVMTTSSQTGKLFEAAAAETILDSSLTTQSQLKTRVVKTKYGRVQGFVTRVGRDAQQQKHVEIFLGVPYASAPTGNYRFAPTRPPVHWSGVREATTHGPVCPQAFPNLGNTSEALTKMPMRWLQFLRKVKPKLAQQSEDCLHLNIYVPKDGTFEESLNDANIDDDAKDNEEHRPSFPVMVFIHGESFSWGSGNVFDGRVLATYGRVIVITLNYRLGVFGFLNTNVSPDRKARMANYGLMDQIAALKWIQENIEQFGGDPNSVTLFGHNTGAACIHFLMQSPVVVPGLFHRAILMSGSRLSEWALVDDPVHYAVQLASKLNCSIPRNMIQDYEEILKCLRGKSVEDLTRVRLETPSFLTGMGPSRDGILIPADFGTELYTPSNRKRAQASPYQVILGMVQDETERFFSDSELTEGFGPETRDKYLRTIVRNTYSYHLNEIYATVQNEYTDWLAWTPPPSPPVSSGSSALVRPRHLQRLASQALTDKLYVAPIVQTANWCNESRYPVYLYVYTQPDNEQEIFSSDPELRRSFHGSMLPLIFGLPFAPELPSLYAPFTSQQGALSQTLITYWSNFAISGNPNRPFNVQNLFGRPTSDSFIYWEPFDGKVQQYLKIDTTSRMLNHYRLHPLSVWLHLIPRLHMAGADNIFPQHNAFVGHDDPSLFTGVVRPSSFAHGYQVNREYVGGTTPPTPVTTCVPVLGQRDAHQMGHRDGSDSSLVLLEQASVHAYRQALYLTVGIGGVLLAVNVWFLVCLFFCRGRLARCCVVDTSEAGMRGMGNKETSCDTELVGLATESMQSIRDHVSGRRRSHSQASLSSLHGQRSSSSIAATPETVRLLQASLMADSDRESRSTSSQSQCGHIPTSKSHSNSLGNGSSSASSSRYRDSNPGGIAFIATASNSSTTTLPLPRSGGGNHQQHQQQQQQQQQRQHQVAFALALANTDHSFSQQPSSSSQQQPRYNGGYRTSTSAASSASLPRKQTSSSNSDFSGRPPSQLEVRSRPSIPNRSEAYCRLHEGYEEAARQSAGAAATPSQPQSALANRNKPGCRLHESGSSNSPEGLSMILPPPLESGADAESSTVKRNPKQKLTTFRTPEAQIMGDNSPRHSSPPMSPRNSTLSPNNHSAGILVNAETAHLHGQILGSL